MPETHLKGYGPEQELKDLDKPVEGMEFLTGVRGSVILADGVRWHTAGINRGKQSRSGIFGQYLPLYITADLEMKQQRELLDNPPELVCQMMGER